jgi:hypothetical protein
VVRAHTVVWFIDFGPKKCKVVCRSVLDRFCCIAVLWVWF